MWPENWRAFTLFCQVSTQWNMGMGGASGLRYEALYPLLDRAAQSAEDWQDLFDSVREIEAGALEAINAE